MDCTDPSGFFAHHITSHNPTMTSLKQLSLRRLKMLRIQARECGNDELLAKLAAEKARRAIEKILREIR